MYDVIIISKDPVFTKSASAYVENEVIYKLTCRHSYHQQCVTSWLTNHNTCPLCRLELPKEENKKTTRRTTPENDHRLPYFR